MVSLFLRTLDRQVTEEPRAHRVSYASELCDEVVPFSSAELAKRAFAGFGVDAIATKGECERALNRLIESASGMEGARLKAAYVLGQRSTKGYRSVVELSSPHAVASYCMKRYSELSQEHFVLLTLNAKNEVISETVISVGTIDKTIVGARDVCRKALDDNARSIILVHNHPSGDPHPSKSDIALTNRVQQAARLFDIDVLDHVILGSEERSYSLRGHGDM